MSADEKKLRSFRFRKDTVFRLYLALFCAFFLFSSLFLISAQSRFYKREIVALRSQLRDVSAEVSKINSVSSSRETPSDDSRASSTVRSREPDPFWIEGHGTNRKWAYLDICFPDGYRARYYFRPWPSKAELVSLHRRISHDSVIHSFPLDSDEEIM